MAIKVVKHPDVYLTASELARYRYEYESQFSTDRARPDFEEWVREQVRLWCVFGQSRICPQEKTK